MAGTITHSWNGTILTITSDSGTSSCDLKGEQGDIGIRGPQGVPGVMGVNGVPGEQGPMGPKGDKGDKGDDGVDGTVAFENLTDAQREMIRGPMGPQGIPGPQGIQGPKGQDGTVSFDELTDEQKAELIGSVTHIGVGRPGTGECAEIFNFVEPKDGILHSINDASGDYSHAEGFVTTAAANSAHAEGQFTHAEGEYSHAEGIWTVASGKAAHAEGGDFYGFCTTASGDYSHAEGHNTNATGLAAHAEGQGTAAEGGASHAEGNNTFATADGAHAEGYSTKASAAYSHAEGYETEANGQASHAAGLGTLATRQAAYVIGRYNEPEAKGYATDEETATFDAYSRYKPIYKVTSDIVFDSATGTFTCTAVKSSSGAFTTKDAYYVTEEEYTAGNVRNYYWQDSQNQHYHHVWSYFLGDTYGDYALTVGNGEDNYTRSNAMTLDWNGNAWFAGGVILTSPNGTRYKLTVDNGGALQVVAV